MIIMQDPDNNEEYEVVGMRTVSGGICVVWILLKNVNDTGTEPTHFVPLAVDNNVLITEIPT